MVDSDARWLRQAGAAWPRVTARYLKTRPLVLPMLVVFDAKCSYRSTPHGSPIRWTARAHRGDISIPDGPRLRAEPQASFNSLETGKGFLVMSLPSVWRTVAPPSDIPLEQFVEGILFHELAHSFQAQATPSLWYLALLKEGYPPAVLGDDAVQHRFARDPAYAAAFAAERDLFYRAVAAPKAVDARALTCSALGKLRSRRARHLSGADARLARVDELSLTSEGLGQWVAFSWLTKERKLPAALVIAKLRSPAWSQDEGLAIFLIVDRLVPNWQNSLLSRSPVSVEGQLERVCHG